MTSIYKCKCDRCKIYDLLAVVPLSLSCPSASGSLRPAGSGRAGPTKTDTAIHHVNHGRQGKTPNSPQFTSLQYGTYMPNILLNRFFCRMQSTSSWVELNCVAIDTLTDATQLSPTIGNGTDPVAAYSQSARSRLVELSWVELCRYKRALPRHLHWIGLDWIVRHWHRSMFYVQQ